MLRIVFLNKLEMQGQFLKNHKKLYCVMKKQQRHFLTKKQTKKQTTT